ncbi:XTP/dITP diphosphatase|uniref:dITP/XTP pyrophosphatase n=1 Tax=Dendrosporobacter quercicolus TaxID=146817 RepID=A0A1H0ADS7_9FIRM|nr:XTP/dITP diphosphatase [Dendrosporobacter quercicolus]NSL50044.1 XTP/dITP diphosphatase [Dendrosporobacter quercicolus DSM 1736]SDN31143.1 XTP/dITP diphosphohydrolase [Dendrosporobacter quercicolus]
MKEIVIASKNAGKVAEIAAALQHLPVRIVSLAELGDVPEAVENGADFSENALIKARFYAASTGKACLADDSGLEVDALGGEPGVYSARYAGETATDAQNNAKLLTKLKGVADEKRTARFRCVLAFVDTDKQTITAQGVCEGEILAAARGAGGFGYDPLFYIPALGQTLAEISIAEKNTISHRGAALRNIAEKLAGYLQ